MTFYNDNLLHIFSFLSSQELATMELVSKQFNSSSRNTRALWQRKIATDFGCTVSMKECSGDLYKEIEKVFAVLQCKDFLHHMWRLVVDVDEDYLDAIAVNLNLQKLYEHPSIAAKILEESIRWYNSPDFINAYGKKNNYQYNDLAAKNKIRDFLYKISCVKKSNVFFDKKKIAKLYNLMYSTLYQDINNFEDLAKELDINLNGATPTNVEEFYTLYYEAIIEEPLFLLYIMCMLGSINFLKIILDIQPTLLNGDFSSLKGWNNDHNTPFQIAVLEMNPNLLSFLLTRKIKLGANTPVEIKSIKKTISNSLKLAVATLAKNTENHEPLEEIILMLLNVGGNYSIDNDLKLAAQYLIGHNTSSCTLI